MKTHEALAFFLYLSYVSFYTCSVQGYKTNFVKKASNQMYNYSLYNNKNSLMTNENGDLLNNHSTTNNKGGSAIKRKHQRSGKRCCGKIYTLGGISAVIESNTDPFEEGVLLEEKYEMIENAKGQKSWLHSEAQKVESLLDKGLPYHWGLSSCGPSYWITQEWYGSASRIQSVRVYYNAKCVSV